MKIALILTNDWELFGDGSGDYYELQHNNLKSFIDLAKQFDAKITIMAEVMQQFAHLQLSKNYPELKKIAEDWENIIKHTIISGHDVQLHIHPQWIDAKYDNNKWSLDLSKWRIASLPDNQIEQLICDGNNYLNSLLKQVYPEYKCLAFRAGSYCIEPSNFIINTLIKFGIKADSSVTKGFKNSNLYNFENSFSSFHPWRVDYKSVQLKGNADLIEFPIFSVVENESQLFKKFTPKLHSTLFERINIPDSEKQWAKNRDKIKELRYPKAQRFYRKNRGFKFYLNTIFSKNVIQLDYDYLTATKFIKVLSKAFNYNTDFEYLPIVASGHFKDIHNLENIHSIFNIIKNDFSDKIEYWTLTKAINYLENKI